MFGLGLKQLEQFCHQMSLMLAAGVPLPRVLNSLSNRGLSSSARPIAARLARDVEAGTSFTQAVERQGRIFPPLMRNLISAGEESGNLEGVMKQLAGYFELQRQIRKKFIMQLIYPVVVTFMAICVMSLLAYVRVSLNEQLSETPTAASESATAAALRTFLTGMSVVGMIVFLYFLFTRILVERRYVQEVLLRMPVIGSVRRNTAVAHFSWSMEMMLKAGVNIRDSLRRALESTSNGAFMARRGQVESDIIGGEAVSTALQKTRLFPEDFMEIVEVAEESGELDESFGRLARLYFERAETGMRVMSAVLSWTIWGVVALMVAFVVISFYLNYFHMLLNAGNIR